MHRRALRGRREAAAVPRRPTNADVVGNSSRAYLAELKESRIGRFLCHAWYKPWAPSAPIPRPFFLLFRVGWHHIFGHAGHIVLQSPRPDGLPDTLTGLASACCSYRNSSIRVKIHRELSANRLAQVTPKGVIIKRFLGGLDKEMRRLDSLVREYLFLRQSFSPGLVRKAGLTERTPTLSLPARCRCCLLYMRSGHLHNSIAMQTAFRDVSISRGTN